MTAYESTRRLAAAMDTAETADDLVEVRVGDLVAVMGLQPSKHDRNNPTEADQNLYCDCPDDPWTDVREILGKLIRIHHGSRTAERRAGFNQLALAVAMQALYNVATRCAMRLTGATDDCMRIELALVSMAWDRGAAFITICGTKGGGA